MLDPFTKVSGTHCKWFLDGKIPILSLSIKYMLGRMLGNA